MTAVDRIATEVAANAIRLFFRFMDSLLAMIFHAGADKGKSEMVC